MWKWLTVLILLLTLASPGCCTDPAGVLSDAKTRAVAGDYATAISLCNGVINQYPGAPVEPKARLLLAKILTKEKAPETECISQFSKVATDFPSSQEAPEALLRIGYLRDRVKQSPAEWEQVVKSYPRTKEAAEALKCLGHLALRNNDPELAIKRFEASSAVPEADAALATESRVEACYARISHYWKTVDTAVLVDAQKAFKQSLSQSHGPQSQEMATAVARLHLGLGEVYLIQGFGDKAAQEYHAVLNQKPDDPYVCGVANYELGCALYTKRDYSGAVSAFTTFIDKQQGDTLAQKDRGWRKNRPGYCVLATTDPEKAQGLSGLELVADAAYWKAASLMELGRNADAKPILDELSEFSGLKICTRIQRMKAICYLALEGENR